MAHGEVERAAAHEPGALHPVRKDEGDMNFFVNGEPTPKGSMRGFFHAKLKRHIMTNANKHTKAWEALVAEMAMHGMGTSAAIAKPTPLLVELRFVLSRPASHTTPRGRLRKGFPAWPIGRKADIDKLARSTLDAMAEIVFEEDSQVCYLKCTKKYAGVGEAPGVHVIVEPI